MSSNTVEVNENLSHGSAGPEPTRNIDRLSLLKDFDAAKSAGGASAGAVAAGDRGGDSGKGKAPPTELVFDNIFEKTAGAARSGSLQSKDEALPVDSGGKGLNGSDLAGAGSGEAKSRGFSVSVAVDAPVDDATPAVGSVSPNEPVTINGRPQALDPKKPTVVVLDDFSKDDPETFTVENGKNLGPSHGEISARGAETNGFNVFRVQMNGGMLDSIEGLEKKIESGEIPIGKGDAITMSFGPTSDPTFSDASDFFHTDINAKNLASKKDAMLGAMRGILAFDQLDSLIAPGSSRERFKEAVGINDAISRLQKETGADVIQASGNEGPDHFSLAFMTANDQLSSADARGKVDGFSANHSLINGSADGIFSVKFNDKTGDFELSNPGQPRPILFSLQEIGSGKPRDRFLDDRSQIQFDQEQGKLTAPLAVTGGSHNVAGLVTGTSFANIGFLREHRLQMIAEKTGEIDPRS